MAQNIKYLVLFAALCYTEIFSIFSYVSVLGSINNILHVIAFFF